MLARTRLRVLAALAAVWGGGGRAACAAGEPTAFVPLDETTVVRKIAKEPAYMSAPRYALFVFDGAAKFRVWAVLDRSKADAPYRDVLWFDRNGNGDLTEAGEKLTTTYNPEGDPAGLGVQFLVGDVTVPGTRETHTALRIATKPKDGGDGVWFQLQWRGEVEISGAYALSGLSPTRWGDSPATAPILRPTADGPLSFATWGAENHVLSPGAGHPLHVLVGHRVRGPAPLCVVDETFLDLTKDVLTITVIGKDAAGREVREATRCTSHC